MATRQSQEDAKLLNGHIPGFQTSVQFAPEHSGVQQNYGSNETKTPDSHFLWDYSETDSLLSNENYGGARRRTSNTDTSVDEPITPRESVCSMVMQILVPFLLAGLGTVSAGMLLESVQSWDVFLEVTELLILVPAVLGMKGNLEMTLASRLSTAVNAGKFLLPNEKWRLITGNLALKQLQATALGLLASLMASLLGWMGEGSVPLNHVVLISSTSVSTAFLASLLQGLIMVGVIIGSKRLGLNPDNLATPMAASFGDLISLALLACFSQWFYTFMDVYPFVLFLVDFLIVCLIPVWIMVCSKHPATLVLLRTGWEPIITAMVISSIGGLILDKAVADPNLAGVIVYAPVINGIGGNLVSIQSSRIATALHVTHPPGEVPEDRVGCYSPFRAFLGSGSNHRSAQVLLSLVIPGQLIFLFAIHVLKGGHTLPSPLFTFLFLFASTIQVFLLLCIADYMVHFLWRREKDPDSYSIPYLTALADLLGTGLLTLTFVILWCIGNPSST